MLPPEQPVDQNARPEWSSKAFGSDLVRSPNVQSDVVRSPNVHSARQATAFHDSNASSPTQGLQHRQRQSTSHVEIPVDNGQSILSQQYPQQLQQKYRDLSNHNSRANVASLPVMGSSAIVDAVANINIMLKPIRTKVKGAGLKGAMSMLETPMGRKKHKFHWLSPQVCVYALCDLRSPS